jgi:chemotaxis protein CheD
VSAESKELFAFRRGNDPYHGDNEVKRFYDPRFKATSVMVLPGRHYVSSDPNEMIVTLLGSCVAACIRDPKIGVGGLNHFLLPESDSGQWGNATAAMCYGNHAMETLINDIIKRGGARDRLEVKVFGGGNIIDSASSSAIGTQNAEFVERYLRNEGFQIAAKHLCGSLPRRIHYFPVAGKVKMLLLRRGPDKDLYRKEMDYRKQIKTETDVDAGDVELFD